MKVKVIFYIFAALLVSFMLYDTFRKTNRVRKTMAKMRNARQFTVEELAQYDGTDPGKPIYLAVKGRVYDVSTGERFYGVGKSYHFFAGKDGARSFATGCFKPDCPLHLDDLTEKQMKSIDDYVTFYDNHHSYFYVGELVQD